MLRPLLNRFTPLRTVGALVSVTLLGLAALSWRHAENHRRNFDRWLEDTPPILDVDLSSPTTITTSFTQTCQIAHGQQLILRVDTEPGDHRDRGLLDDLKANVVLRDSAGRVLFEDAPEGGDPWGIDPVEGLLLTRGYFGPDGTHVLELTVLQGAPALAGRKLQLIVKNELCGCEVLAAFFLEGLAFILGSIGAIVLLPTILSLAKPVERPLPRSAQAAPEGARR